MNTRAVVHRAVILMAALALNAQEGAAQRVTGMRVGLRLKFIGDRVGVDALNARVVDNSGRPVSNAALAYRSSDPAIAAVTTGGDVVARKPGKTRVWAVYGRDSASSLILVEQWASKFAFSPAAVRLDAIGAKQPLKVLVSDAAGVPVAGETSKTSPCRSVNDRVATLTTTGDVIAVGNGSTYVRCVDRGIADSVKIDVQQRATLLQITNKSVLSRKTFGDTFSIKISTKDRLGRDVLDARPTWASLNAAAVSVEPLTGKARAVNSGDSKIIVQIGNVADSTTINVSGGPVFAPIAAPTTATDSGASSSKASVSTQDIVMTVEDTAIVSVVATDSAGAPIQNPRFKLRVGDNSVAKPLDSARVVALKVGQTRLIVEYASHVDSSRSVYINAKGAAGRATSSSGADSASKFAYPPTYKDSVNEYLKTRAATKKEIATDPETAAKRKNFLFSVNGVAAIADHLSQPSAGVTEDRTGVLTGGAGVATLFQYLELGGTVRLGTLASVGTVGEDLAFSEGEGSLGIFPIRELGIRAGYMLRTEKTKVATQTWTIPKVSLVTRFGFIGDVVNTFVAFSILPKATFTGAPTESPSIFSRAGEAGLELRTKYINAGLTYYAEHFSFDNSPRVEEFSAVRFRVGFQLGR